MLRSVLGFAMSMALLVTLGCGGGYSTEKAEQVCEQERVSKAACMTDEAIDDCVACYQECGNACNALATCPETFACD